MMNDIDGELFDLVQKRRCKGTVELPLYILGTVFDLVAAKIDHGLSYSKRQ